jgi:hypothetical protein
MTAAPLPDPDETSGVAMPNQRPSRRSSPPDAMTIPASISRALPKRETLAAQLNPDARLTAESNTAPRLGERVEQRDQVGIGTQSTRVSLFDPTLDILACTLDDLETTRIALGHRLRIATAGGPDEAEVRKLLGLKGDPKPDKDDVDRGFALSLTHPAVRALVAHWQQVYATEHGAELAMNRQLRTHPLHPWIKAQRGLGEKQTARLLSAIKDPYWNDLHDRPRTVSELWAFAGYKPGQRRRKGEQANWSATAKMRAYLVAESCLRAQGPYSEVYYDRKAHTEGRLHTEPCVRCGPSGKPALPGTPLSDKHRHVDALRVVAKTVLRDLWREAKRIHAT